jgi:predicted PurR-regulated permease PerM
MTLTVQPPPLASTAIARNSLVIIAVVVTGAALHWMSDIITPLLLAMFLAVMVDGFGRVIRRRAPFLPARLAITVAIGISALLFACCAIIVADRAPSFLDALARDEPRLISLITEITQSLGSRAPVNAQQILTSLDPTAYLGTLAQALQNIATSAFLVLVYLGFLIASRHAFERKVLKLFKGRETRQEALGLFLRIRDGMERYLWIQTVLGVVIAAASWVVMVLVGLENPFFWAFLVFIVNYVPIVGAVAAIALPALFALLQFGGWQHAVVLLVGLWLITFVVGNILLPRMQGDSLNMDPLIVLLSLAFWGAIWGLPGMFLSTPLTVLTMVILAQFDGSRWIAIILSADGDPQGLGRGSRVSPDHHEVAPEAAK